MAEDGAFDDETCLETPHLNGSISKYIIGPTGSEQGHRRFPPAIKV